MTSRRIGLGAGLNSGSVPNSRGGASGRALRRSFQPIPYGVCAHVLNVQTATVPPSPAAAVTSRRCSATWPRPIVASATLDPPLHPDHDRLVDCSGSSPAGGPTREHLRTRLTVRARRLATRSGIGTGQEMGLGPGAHPGCGPISGGASVQGVRCDRSRLAVAPRKRRPALTLATAIAVPTEVPVAMAATPTGVTMLAMRMPAVSQPRPAAVPPPARAARSWPKKWPTRRWNGWHRNPGGSHDVPPLGAPPSRRQQTCFGRLAWGRLQQLISSRTDRTDRTDRRLDPSDPLALLRD